jgi:flagellar basal-body rod protein FlgG
VQPALRRVERSFVLGTQLAPRAPVTDGLTHSVQALGSAEKRMEMIAANLANLSAPGFKRSADVAHSFDQVLGNRVERRTVSRRETDFSQGTLQASGNTYDLALHGRGFFTVEGAQGEL